MSGYILCQVKKAEKPFFIENISTNIYSIEELCYYLYNNLYLIDSSLINQKLCTWIEEELELPKLAAKLRPYIGRDAGLEEILYPVFKEINYLAYEELRTGCMSMLSAFTRSSLRKKMQQRFQMR